jgi:hypothetical protein
MSTLAMSIWIPPRGGELGGEAFPSGAVAKTAQASDGQMNIHLMEIRVTNGPFRSSGGS